VYLRPMTENPATGILMILPWSVMSIRSFSSVTCLMSNHAPVALSGLEW